MQVFNSFQEMTGTDAGVQSTMDVFNLEQADSHAVKNSIFDLSSGGTPPVSSVPPTGDGKNIPQRVKTLEEKVGALEVQMGNVVQGIAAIRQDIAKIPGK